MLRPAERRTAKLRLEASLGLWALTFGDLPEEERPYKHSHKAARPMAAIRVKPNAVGAAQQYSLAKVVQSLIPEAIGARMRAGRTVRGRVAGAAAARQMRETMVGLERDRRALRAFLGPAPAPMPAAAASCGRWPRWPLGSCCA